MTNRFNFTFAAMSAAMLFGVAPLHAQEATTQRRIVAVTGLDLTTDAGAATLRHRVRVAARQVCGEPAMIGDPDQPSYAACVEGAEQSALKTSDALIASVRGNALLALNQPNH